jgi:hypothetical protein
VHSLLPFWVLKVIVGLPTDRIETFITADDGVTGLSAKTVESLCFNSG